MIQDDTVRRLMQISVPKSFKAKEYICYEGQPGNEMYIILRGSVGIYVSSAIETQVEVSRIMAGDFFGEMSIFDNLPRSASCIALEDVICIAVGKDKLESFFSACPDMAMKLLENMSGRIRKLDNALYKSERFVQNKKLPVFEIPSAYSFSHIVEEPAHNLNFTEPVTADCPICGRSITVINLKKRIMSMHKLQSDGRIKYAECEPLWYDIWNCPYCHYSNYYLSFFRMLPFKKEFIKRILREQHTPVLAKAMHLTTPFDHLVLKYLQAIHINEACNANDHTLIGKMWLALYWLCDDAGDIEMKHYSAASAAAHLTKAIEEELITDEYSKQSLALTLTHLYLELGQNEQAAKMCELAVNGNDSQLKAFAYRLKL
ncbi:MAG: DUF2225 domain-containing protein [Oscillospiraceae bacterium]|nr:DUF2225 domain-containing protein [Oscillospiraceae bacterium]